MPNAVPRAPVPSPPRAGRRVLILTCEHASNHIPKEWAAAFRGKEKLLASHRGFDLGAKEVASGLARLLDAPLLSGTASRLLVDLNRSPGHPRRFSEISRCFPESERRLILQQEYLPHRAAVEQAISLSKRRGIAVVHVAIHSFTPVLNGVRRTADIGLLFDPRRAGESALCRAWKVAILRLEPGLRVRLNYPYKGVSDCLPTALRRTHDSLSYVGVEVELCDALLGTHPGVAHAVKTLGAALTHVLSDTPHQP
jgi:predicted N-formylglutamate amidohydrolase